MEGALQSVKALLTALASQFYNMIKDEIVSIKATINHVKVSVREAMERMDQKLAEEEVLRIKKERNLEERSESFQTSHQAVMPCRRENNDDEEEESEVDDLNSAMGSSNRIQVDEDEFLDSNSKFQDMGKDEAAGEDVGDVDISK